MTWRVEFQDSARKDLRKLDPSLQQRLLRYLRSRIATGEDPQRFGKPLSGQLGEYWSYRIGDYRVICEILQGRETV